MTKPASCSHSNNGAMVFPENMWLSALPLPISSNYIIETLLIFLELRSFIANRWSAVTQRISHETHSLLMTYLELMNIGWTFVSFINVPCLSPSEGSFHSFQNLKEAMNISKTSWYFINSKWLWFLSGNHLHEAIKIVIRSNRLFHMLVNSTAPLIRFFMFF